MARSEARIIKDHDDEEPHHEIHYSRSCTRQATSRIWVNVKFSKGYLFTTVLLSLLCFIVIVWELSGKDSKHWLPMLCEGIINFVLVCDVGLDIASQGWTQYSSRCINWVDMVVTLACVTFFIALIARKSTSGVYDAELSHLDIAFLSVRYLFMVFRIWVVFSKAKRGVDMRAQDDVDFEKVDEGETEEVEPLNSGSRDAEVGSGFHGHSS